MIDPLSSSRAEGVEKEQRESMQKTSSFMIYPFAPATFHVTRKSNPDKTLYVGFGKSDSEAECLRGFQVMILKEPGKLDQYVIDLDFCSPRNRAKFKILLINAYQSLFISEEMNLCHDVGISNDSWCATTLETTNRVAFFEILDFIIHNNHFDAKAEEELEIIMLSPKPAKLS